MAAHSQIPAWQLYGESTAFPDVLHCERIQDRAEGLDWTIAAHRHVHLHQFFLLLQGEIEMQIDGDRLAITPPAAVSIPRDAVHGFTFSAGTEGYVVSLPASDWPDLFGPESETAALLARPFRVPAGPVLTLRFLSLARRHEQAAALRRSQLRAEAAMLVSEVLEPLAATAPPAPQPADPRVQGFDALLRRHFRDPWGVADYARALGLSPRHLARMCRAATGQSPRAAIEAQRVREACRLLAYTRMPVQQVGYALGFDDPSYFSRVFQRATGLPPTEYRRRLNG